MAKRPDRDDDKLPDFLYQFTPDEEARVTRALGQAAKDLGRPETVLAPPLDFLGSSPWVTLAASLMMLNGVVMIPLLLKRTDPTKPDYEREMAFGTYAWYAVTAVFAVLAAYTLFLFSRPWWLRGEKWFFFRDGVVRANFGLWPLVLRWEDLTAYKTEARWIGDWYKFQGADKKSVKLFVHRFLPRSLPETLLDRHILSVGPGMLRRIEAGEEVKFGPFALSRDALAYKDKFRDKEVAREKIDRIEVESTEDTKLKPELIVLAGQSRWVSADLSEKVPNAWLMLWLVRKIRPELIRDFDQLRRVLS